MAKPIAIIVPMRGTELRTLLLKGVSGLMPPALHFWIE